MSRWPRHSGLPAGRAASCSPLAHGHGHCVISDLVTPSILPAAGATALPTHKSTAAMEWSMSLTRKEATTTPWRTRARSRRPGAVRGPPAAADAAVEARWHTRMLRHAWCGRSSRPHGARAAAGWGCSWAERARRDAAVEEEAATARNPASSKKLGGHYVTRGSQVIPQPSTSRAQPRLTSEF